MSTKMVNFLELDYFYTNTNVDINGVSQKTDVDAYSIALMETIFKKDNKTTIYYQVHILGKK